MEGMVELVFGLVELVLSVVDERRSRRRTQAPSRGRDARDALRTLWRQAAVALHGSFREAHGGSSGKRTRIRYGFVLQAQVPVHHRLIPVTVMTDFLATGVSAPRLEPAPVVAMHHRTCGRSEPLPLHGPHLVAMSQAKQLAPIDPGRDAVLDAQLARLPDPYCGGLAGFAWAWRLGAEDQLERLLAAIRSVAALSQETTAVVCWRRLAESLGATASGERWDQLALEGFHAGVTYFAEVQGGAEPHTRVSIERARGEATAEPAGAEHGGGRVAVQLPGIRPSAREIRAAVERLVQLAGSHGIYR
jgi:hypothetical protein